MTLRTRAILLITITVVGGTLLFAFASTTSLRATYEDLTGPAVQFRQEGLLRGLQSRLGELANVAALRNGINAVEFLEDPREDSAFLTRLSVENASQMDVEALVITDLGGTVVASTIRGSATPELVDELSRQLTGDQRWTGIFAGDSGTGLLVAEPLRFPGVREYSGHLWVFDAFDDEFSLGDEFSLDGIRFQRLPTDVKIALIPSPFVPIQSEEAVEFRPEYVPTTVLRIETPAPGELQMLETRAIRDTILRTVLFGALIGLVLLVWFERRLLSRMSTLSGLVSAATEEGDVRPTVEVGGSDELADLAHRIEETLTSLEVARDDLSEANEALVAADLAKNSFISVVSHELRTPLTAILGFTETMRTHWESLDAERAQDFLARMSSQATALDRMVEDLLVLSRMQSGRFRYEPEVLLIRTALVELFRAMPGGDAVDLSGTDDLPVVADPDHLRRIVTNYVENAFKYGAPPIRIVTEVEGSMLTLRVVDHGDGVPDEFVPELFERFTQASRGDMREATGVGLGLSIVRQLAEHNGGRAWYERSKGLPAFALSLPMASADDVVDGVAALTEPSRS